MIIRVKGWWKIIIIDNNILIYKIQCATKKYIYLSHPLQLSCYCYLIYYYYAWFLLISHVEMHKKCTCIIQSTVVNYSLCIPIYSQQNLWQPFDK